MNKADKIIRRESQLVEYIVKYSKEAGYIVKTEVGNMGQSIDVVIEKDGIITAIEAKLSNWKRAFEQCKAHELVADYIVVVMSQCNMSGGCIAMAENTGYGLMNLNPYTLDFDIIRDPMRQKNNWEPQKKIFIEYFHNT